MRQEERAHTGEESKFKGRKKSKSSRGRHGEVRNAYREM